MNISKKEKFYEKNNHTAKIILKSNVSDL